MDCQKKSGHYLLFTRSGITMGSFVKKLKCFYKQLELQKHELFLDWSKKTKSYKTVTHWMDLPEKPKD